MSASETIPLARLSRATDTDFTLEPEAEARRTLAQDLGIDGIRKLRFQGRLIPEGARDWRLEGDLGATVVQPCVVTLDPVTTRIDQPVTRRYLADLELPHGVAGQADPDGEAEFEMPEDDSVDPLPATLDLAAVMAEALALALPLYPRAPGVEAADTVFAAPGVTPMTDDDAKPLAGLAALKDKLSQPQDPEDEPEK
ncbi:MAG: YceD family protein [Pseudomonadota bacterium]